MELPHLLFRKIYTMVQKTINILSLNFTQSSDRQRDQDRERHQQQKKVDKRRTKVKSHFLQLHWTKL